MVAGDAVHIAGGKRDPTENIASADYDADLNPFSRDCGDFRGKIANPLCVKTKGLRPGHRFAAEFKEYPFVFRHAEL
jgi:hypothetical protein